MLKSESKKLSKKEFTGEGTVVMKSYAPNVIEYEAKLKGDQLVVFSEIYYKDGWTAYVDGKETEILKVNYLLRGLEVKGGEHKIVFKFDIPEFHSASKMAYAGSILVFLFIGWGVYSSLKAKKNSVEQKEEA